MLPVYLQTAPQQHIKDTRGNAFGLLQQSLVWIPATHKDLLLKYTPVASMIYCSLAALQLDTLRLLDNLLLRDAQLWKIIAAGLYAANEQLLDLLD